MEKTNKKTNSNSNSGSIGTSISGFSEISDHEEDFLNVISFISIHSTITFH